MSPLPTLRLNAGEERRLRAGHLWVFSNEVDTDRTPLKAFAPGEPVVIEDARGRALGIGYANPHSLICARLISRDTETHLDRSTLVHRLQVALGLRERLYPGGYYRLVHGEGDGLPGLVIDRFGDVCVVQPNTAGIDRVLDTVLEALERVIAPRHVLIRADSSVRELEGLDSWSGWHGNEGPAQLLVRENDCEFVVPALDGQKTGWYYDQRENRRLLARFASGQRVVDGYAYAGGFAIVAARAGAREVVAIERSWRACDALLENAERNDVADRITVVEGETGDYLAESRLHGERFDVAVIDPPAFIKRRRDQKPGERAYRSINESALRSLGPDGILVSCSCSSHLSVQRLQELILRAGRHIDRSVRTLAKGHAPPDHPVHPAIPETEYLKALVVRSVLTRTLP